MNRHVSSAVTVGLVGLVALGAGLALAAHGPAVSSNGRYVVFSSDASNLVPGDTNRKVDVFVRDRVAGTTESVSVALDGGVANGDSGSATVSGDGRFVAFDSQATNLVAGDTNGVRDVFVRDLVAGTTERVSVSRDGGQLAMEAWGPSLSGDGRIVAFTTISSGLVAGDTNGRDDVFVHDLESGATERVSVATGGAQGNGHSNQPSTSADGRTIAFASDSSTLVPGDTNGARDIFVHDRVTGATERVDVDTEGRQVADGADEPTLSADGRIVAFVSDASDVVPGDTNGQVDVFVRDRVAGTTERVSVGSRGAQGDDWSGGPLLSADGRLVAFSADASTLVAGDTNESSDVFVRDRAARTTERVSVGVGGVQADSDSYAAALSADGRTVVLDSHASNLVVDDANDGQNVFVHDRGVGTTELASVPIPPALAGRLTSSPPRPRAGRPLVASTPITIAGKPAAVATVTCTANIVGRSLPALAAGYDDGRARCTWSLPAASSAETLDLRITATTSNGAAMAEATVRVAGLARPAGRRLLGWRVVVAGAEVPALNDVAAVSATDVWAVGSTTTKPGQKPVIAHWDGRRLRVTRAFVPRSGSGVLTAVSATAADDVWAVGSDGWEVARPVVMHWDGRAWARVTTPASAASGFLAGVIALSRADVWAVGGSGDDDADSRPLIMHWNGRGWRLFDLKGVPPGASYLSGVDASSPDDVWAVGVQDVDAPNLAGLTPLALHWNGRVWAVVAALGIGSQLDAVDVRSARDIWTLAFSYGSEDDDVAHWDGARQKVAYRYEGSGTLSGLAAVSPTGIWVVGQSSWDPAHPLVVRGDGRTWGIVPTPFARLRGASLVGVAARSPADVWAVGEHLIARYSR